METVSFDDVSYFIDILHQFGTNKNDNLTDSLLTKMAFDNTNTSYIEPYVEAAYKANHPEKAYLAKMYGDFVASLLFAPANQDNATRLVYKLLDERYYARRDFPMHSFCIMGRQGVTIAPNAQERLLYRALASSTPIEHIKSTLQLLNLDANNIKDSQQRTLLHNFMADNKYSKTDLLEQVLDRACKLGMTPSPDIFGRYPDEFGTPKTRLLYAQYFEAQTQEPLSALAAYLQNTLHNFNGLGSVEARNTDVYLKSPSPLDYTPKSTMFEHVLQSNNMTIISEFQRFISPRVEQSMDIESTLSYVFLEKIVCAPNSKPEIVNALFELLQKNDPKDLSTALGYFLMRNEKYYNDYVSQLAQYTPAIENIMECQKKMGLTDLLELEANKLDIIAPQNMLDTSLSMQ